MINKTIKYIGEVGATGPTGGANMPINTDLLRGFSFFIIIIKNGRN